MKNPTNFLYNQIQTLYWDVFNEVRKEKMKTKGPSTSVKQINTKRWVFFFKKKEKQKKKNMLQCVNPMESSFSFSKLNFAISKFILPRALHD